MADKKEFGYKDILGRISNDDIHGAFLFHGSEPYYMDFLCKKIKEATVGDDVLNYTKYTTMPEMGDLVSNCMGFPMFAEHKVIIVYDSGLFTAGKKDEESPDGEESNSNAREELIDLLENLPDTTILIFRESQKVTKTLRTYKAMMSYGTVVACEKETVDSLKKFLASYAHSEKRGITKDAAELMCVGIGDDIARLKAEMDKLILYKKPGETIEEDDVRAVCKLSLTAMSWDLTDAIMHGRREKALIYLQTLLDERTPANVLFAAITKMYIQQYNIKSLMMQGYSTDQAASKLHIHPFVAGKYAQALRNVPLSFIAKKADYSIELTEENRSGKISDVYALQLLVSD